MTMALRKRKRNAAKDIDAASLMLPHTIVGGRTRFTLGEPEEGSSSWYSKQSSTLKRLPPTSSPLDIPA